MKLLIDFIPVLVFFVVYKMFGIFQATMASMLCCLLHIGYTALRKKTVAMTQWLTTLSIGIMGTLTLILKNTWFIKMKPTVLYWLMSIAIWGVRKFKGKFLFSMLNDDKSLDIPPACELTLHRAMIGFFLFMGCLNGWIAQNFSTDTWVHFKLYGSLGVSLIFVLGLSLYLSRSIESNPS